MAVNKLIIHNFFSPNVSKSDHFPHLLCSLFRRWNFTLLFKNHYSPAQNK